MPKVKWRNLLTDECPKCGHEVNPSDHGVACSSSSCDFFITRERYDSLKDDLARSERGESHEWDGYGGRPGEE